MAIPLSQAKKFRALKPREDRTVGDRNEYPASSIELDPGSLCREMVGGAAGLSLPPGGKSPIAPPLIPEMASAMRRSLRFVAPFGAGSLPALQP